MLAWLIRRCHPSPPAEPNRHSRRALAALDSHVGVRAHLSREVLADEKSRLRQRG